MTEQARATVVVSRDVLPGREAQFDAWVRRLDDELTRTPGHVASVRLQEPGGLNHLVTVFDTEADLREWESSTRRGELSEQGDRISLARRQRPDSVSGPWIAVPSGAAVTRWKTFLTTWVAVYPLLLAINATVLALPPVAGLPTPAQLAVSSVLLTGCLTWVVLPVVTRWLRPWLVPH